MPVSFLKDLKLSSFVSKVIVRHCSLIPSFLFLERFLASWKYLAVAFELFFFPQTVDQDWEDKVSYK